MTVLEFLFHFRLNVSHTFYQLLHNIIASSYCFFVTINRRYFYFWENPHPLHLQQWHSYVILPSLIFKYPTIPIVIDEWICNIVFDTLPVHLFQTSFLRVIPFLCRSGSCRIVQLTSGRYKHLSTLGTAATYLLSHTLSQSRAPCFDNIIPYQQQCMNVVIKNSVLSLHTTWWKSCCITSLP